MHSSPSSLHSWMITYDILIEIFVIKKRRNLNKAIFTIHRRSKRRRNSFVTMSLNISKKQKTMLSPPLILVVAVILVVVFENL